MAKTFTAQDVAHIAALAHIPVTQEEDKKLAAGFTKTITVIEELNKLDVKGVDASHVIGLTNVLREDIVDEKRMFTQEQALANAPRKDGGFFVVDQVIEQEE